MMVLQSVYDICLSNLSSKLKRVDETRFVNGILGGAFISIGCMMMLLVKSDPSLPPAVSSLVAGLAFSCGLFFVICAGADLVTGNVLTSLSCMVRLGRWSDFWWLLVGTYGGNLIGCCVMVLVAMGCGLCDTLGTAAVAVAMSKVAQPWYVSLMRGALCNFLVCLAVWMSMRLSDKTSAIALPVTAFVALGMEHCVANMFLIPFAVGCGASITIPAMLANLAVVSAGNLIGGLALAYVLKLTR